MAGIGTTGEDSSKDFRRFKRRPYCKPGWKLACGPTQLSANLRTPDGRRLATAPGPSPLNRQNLASGIEDDCQENNDHAFARRPNTARAVPVQHARRLIEERAIAVACGDTPQRDAFSAMAASSGGAAVASSIGKTFATGSKVPTLDDLAVVAGQPGTCITYGDLAPVEAPLGSPLLPPAVGSAARPSPHRPYRWMPTQLRQHGFTETHCFLGVHVNTLTLHTSCSEETWHAMALATHPRFRVARPPRCCLVGDSGGVVLCDGAVMGACPSEPGESAFIARLPEGFRPDRSMIFAAKALDAQGPHGRVGNASPQLVMLIVMPDGWIQGVARQEIRGMIDLSAVRFSLGRGMSLVDEVRLHMCGLGNGVRLVLLQGTLDQKSFGEHGNACVAQLPQACSPFEDLPFVVAGLSRVGGFHLVMVRRTSAKGAELVWLDSHWEGHDRVNFSGVIYEAVPLPQRPSYFASGTGMAAVGGAPLWTPVRKQICVGDFQRRLLTKYGTIEYAWRKAFNICDSSGFINFTKFSAGCKAAGYVGDINRLWAMLDEDGSGEISYEELAMEVGGPSTSRLEEWRVAAGTYGINDKSVSTTPD